MNPVLLINYNTLDNICFEFSVNKKNMHYT